MTCFNGEHTGIVEYATAEIWTVIVAAPRPGISKPESRQCGQSGRIGPAVEDASVDENVFGRHFCIRDLDIEKTVIAKYPSVP